MDPKVLVLGKGYIGNALISGLGRYNISHALISKADVDYTDSDALFRYIRENGPFTVCVNCSGYTGSPNVDAAEFEKDKCRLLNVETPINVYDVCEKCSIRYVHISSGCIYTGYDRFWTEEDVPTFGYDNPAASWYSKTKHMAERALETEGCYCVRLRMPFSGYRHSGGQRSLHSRDLLSKLLKYDTIVNTLNSKTYIPALVEFLVKLIIRTNLENPRQMEVYNYCCQEPLSTEQIMDIVEDLGVSDKDYKWVDWDDLDIIANRSNCILSVKKAIDHGFKVPFEADCWRECLS